MSHSIEDHIMEPQGHGLVINIILFLFTLLYFQTNTLHFYNNTMIHVSMLSHLKKYGAVHHGDGLISVRAKIQ